MFGRIVLKNVGEPKNQLSDLTIEKSTLFINKRYIKQCLLRMSLEMHLIDEYASTTSVPESNKWIKSLTSISFLPLTPSSSSSSSSPHYIASISF